jgi:hypothetical protein
MGINEGIRMMGGEHEFAISNIGTDGRDRSDHKLGSLGWSNDADSCESSGDQVDYCNASHHRLPFQPLLVHIDSVL